MNDQNAALVITWLQNNRNRPLSFMEKELLKSIIDQAGSVGDILNAVSNISGLPL